MVDTFLFIAMKKHMFTSSAQLLPMMPLLFSNEWSLDTKHKVIHNIIFLIYVIEMEF